MIPMGLIKAAIKQFTHNIRVPTGRSDAQHGSTVRIDGIDGGTPEEKQLDDVHVTIHYGCDEGTPSTPSRERNEK